MFEYILYFLAGWVIGIFTYKTPEIKPDKPCPKNKKERKVDEFGLMDALHTPTMPPIKPAKQENKCFCPGCSMKSGYQPCQTNEPDLNIPAPDLEYYKND